MIIILLLIFLIHFIDTHCIFTENYWKHRELKEWPKGLQSRILCNHSWFELLHLRNNTLWNRTFREICITNLNNYTEGIEKGEEVLKGMEVMCNFTERWRDSWEIILPELMDGIIKYNRGLSEHPLCPLTHSPLPFPSTAAATTSFVYVQMSDNPIYIGTIVLLSILTTLILLIWIKRNDRRHVKSSE